MKCMIRVGELETSWRESVYRDKHRELERASDVLLKSWDVDVGNKKKIKAEKDNVTRKSTPRSILMIKLSKKCVTAENFDLDAMWKAN